MKRILCPLLCLFLLGLYHKTAFGQSNPNQTLSGPNFDYANSVSLKEVTFGRPLQGSGEWIVIRNDLDDFDISGIVSTQAWNKNGEIKPVAYVSGSTPRVSATFDIVCNGPADQKFYAKAEHPDGHNMPVKELFEFTGEWLYLETSMDQGFPQEEVGIWEDFELTWYWSNSENGPWGRVEASKNPMYVTHDIPLVSASTKVFHTVLHLGCINAKGLTMEKPIVNGIYSEFLNRSVKKLGSNNDMTYWRPVNPAPEPACFTTAGLLRYEDSRCGAWARLFRDMVLVQGITDIEIASVDWSNPLSTADVNQLDNDINTFFMGEPATSDISVIELNPGTGQIVGLFFVKKWNFNSSIGPSGGTGINSKFFIHETDPNNTQSITIANGNTINWAELTGIPAQGNGDPQSFFADHAIVKYDGDYFDPSYGTPPQSSGNDWEDASIDGFGTFFFYDRIENNIVKTYHILWNGHNNTAIQQTIIAP